MRKCAPTRTMARDIASEAERLPDDAGIAGAECILGLRDAQRCMRSAQDAMRLAVAQHGDDKRNSADVAE